MSNGMERADANNLLRNTLRQQQKIGAAVLLKKHDKDSRRTNKKTKTLLMSREQTKVFSFA